MISLEKDIPLWEFQAGKLSQTPRRPVAEQPAGLSGPGGRYTTETTVQEIAQYNLAGASALGVGWHYLPNATCQIRPHLFSTALLFQYS